MPKTTRTARLTALIVDHNRESRETLAQFLSNVGMNTVEAADGMHGLAKATTILPDVIATALELPRMGGLEMCRWLRTQQPTQGIPVIGLSESTEGDEVEAARKAGCVSVLLKPCLPEELFAEIHRVLETRHNDPKQR